MRKHVVIVIAGFFATLALAGCASKDNGGTTNPDDLDENAVYDTAIADQARQVTTSVSQAGVASMGSVSVSVVDSVPDDSAGALDKADFTLDATDANGIRTQATLRSMVTGAAVGATTDFLGGVAVNQEINGDAPIGIKEFPKTKAYLAFTGLARLRINNTSIDGSHFVVVWVSKGIRNNADNTPLSQVDAKDLELHVIFPGKLWSEFLAIPTVADGFLYYYFENVRLKQLSPDEKAKVGEGLSPPEVPNLAPVAVARVLVDGKAVNVAKLENAAGVLNITLDGTLSSDADGSVQSYAWEVRQYNSTGGFEVLNKTKGANVTVSIREGGLKQITLRIIDDRGGIANDTEVLYVDYHFKTTGSFGQLGPAGAGTDCQLAFNCLAHTLSLKYGALKLVVKKPVATGSGQCNTPTIQLKLNDQEVAKSAANADLTVSDAAKLKVGTYTINIFWQAQAQCVYNLEADVTYTPPSATA